MTALKELLCTEPRLESRESKKRGRERGDTTTKVAELLQWSAVGNREQRSESRRKHFDDKANPTKLDC